MWPMDHGPGKHDNWQFEVICAPGQRQSKELGGERSVHTGRFRLNMPKLRERGYRAVVR